MRKYLILLLILSLVWAENNAVDFTQGGLSAKHLALGNSRVAGSGIEAVFQNPAAINVLTGQYEFTSAAVNNFSLMQRMNYGAAAQTAPWNNWGFNLSTAKIEDIPKTSWGDDDRPVYEGDFSSEQNQYLITYGSRLDETIDYGINFRSLSYKIDTYTAQGLGVDLGILYNVPYAVGNGTATLGASLKHIGRTKISWSTGHYDTIPMCLAGGGTLYETLWDKVLVISSSLTQTELEPLAIHNGLEYWLIENLAVRAGLDNGSLTLGLGLNYHGLALDYAQAEYDELGIIQRISCRLEF